MAILSFPAIAPNKINSIQLPDFSLLVREWESGGENRRTAQTVGAGVQLNLSYQLISHSQASTIMTFWGTAKGSWLSFMLPTVIIEHPSNIKIGLANLKSTTLWRFSENLSMKTDYATLQRGLYSFDVTIQSVVS